MNEDKIELPIDSVLAALQRRISQVIMDCAMTEAQIVQLNEQIASLRAENEILVRKVNGESPPLQVVPKD